MKPTVITDDGVDTWRYICSGVILFFTVWCAELSRGLWQVLAVAGAVGFGAAIGVHPLIGYVDAGHLAPAVGGALLYACGLALTFPRTSAKVAR